MHEIIAGLRRRHWTVDLFAPSYASSGERAPLWRRFLEYGVLQAKLIARLHRYDAIYVRNHFLALPTALAGRLCGKPVIHEINGPYEDIVTAYPWTQTVFPLLRWIQRLQFRWADRLVVVTETLRSWANAETGHHRIDLIPNGANTELFNPSRKGESGIDGKFAVFFGGLAPWHRASMLVQAAQSPHWPDDVKLVIIGEGQESPIVREAAQKCDRIVYLGKQPYRAVGAYVADALCGLVPIGPERAQSGAFPLKLFEIMAAGVPSIVTDLPGQADLVRESGCGMVVPVDDPAALAQAVAQLAADTEACQAMGRIGSALIEAEHSWDCRAHATHDCLTLLIARS